MPDPAPPIVADTTLAAPPRWPIWSTIIVAAAVATMIALGIWQIDRAQQKDALVALYTANQTRPVTSFPLSPVARPEDYLFRNAAANCLRVVRWQSVAGRNAADQPGIVHLADCARGGAEGPGFTIVAGWSESPTPPGWPGGRVTGRIGAGANDTMRLVSATGLGGLAAAQPPTMDNIPQNHRFYAVQWFLFAFFAAVIYFFAVRQRMRAGR